MHACLTERCLNWGFSMGISVLSGFRPSGTSRRYHKTEEDGSVLHGIVIWLLFGTGGTRILDPPQTCTCMCTCVCAQVSVVGGGCVAAPSLWEKVLCTSLLLGMADSLRPFCGNLKGHEGTCNKDFFFSCVRRSLIVWPLCAGKWKLFFHAFMG